VANLALHTPRLPIDVRVYKHYQIINTIHLPLFSNTVLSGHFACSEKNHNHGEGDMLLPPEWSTVPKLLQALTTLHHYAIHIATTATVQAFYLHVPLHP
jgi:hypothetical protein